LALELFIGESWICAGVDTISDILSKLRCHCTALIIETKRLAEGLYREERLVTARELRGKKGIMREEKRENRRKGLN
jgi:hypothetical protein